MTLHQAKPQPSGAFSLGHVGTSKAWVHQRLPQKAEGPGGQEVGLAGVSREKLSYRKILKGLVDN